MSTRISTTTAYHVQFNDQLKWINQMMKIILYFAQERNSDTEFIEFLSAFKWVFNNSFNVFTDCSLNEIIYSFKLADSFDIVTADAAEDFETQWIIHQQKAQDSIAWANLIMKYCYDKYYIFLCERMNRLQDSFKEKEEFYW